MVRLIGSEILEKEQLEQKLKQEQTVPDLLNCIAYLIIVIVITIFIYFLSDYFYLNLYTAEGASSILNLIGINSYVNSSGTYVVIYASGQPFTLIKACSGIEAIALVSGLILATPTSWGRKIGGVVFITLGIFAANILRIMTTLILAVQGFPQYVYHEVISAIFTIIFIIVFILMIQAWVIPNFIDSLINTMIGIVGAIKGK